MNKTKTTTGLVVVTILLLVGSVVAVLIRALITIGTEFGNN